MATNRRCDGIAIYMYYRDHPPSHFHAIYGQYEAVIGIDPIRVREGKLPRRALSLVLEWAAMYQEELRANWTRARGHQPLQPIPPLV
ncbi:MAG: DUF4160 domain-containing protein [Anaerolineae bacterium]